MLISSSSDQHLELIKLPSAGIGFVKLRMGRLFILNDSLRSVTCSDSDSINGRLQFFEMTDLRLLGPLLFLMMRLSTSPQREARVDGLLSLHGVLSVYCHDKTVGTRSYSILI